jgi:hypothetical protein
MYCMRGHLLRFGFYCLFSVRYLLAQADATTTEKDVARLAEGLRHSDVNVRAGAASALVQLGPSGIPSIIAAASNSNAGVRRTAVTALGEVSPANRDVVLTLLGALKDIDREVRERAGYVLMRIRPSATDVVSSLIVRLKQDSDASVRLHATYVLGAIGPAAKDAVPTLIALLNDSDSQVRSYAASALGTIGLEAKDAVPALSSILTSDTVCRSIAGNPGAKSCDVLSRQFALEALMKIAQSLQDARDVSANAALAEAVTAANSEREDSPYVPNLKRAVAALEDIRNHLPNGDANAVLVSDTPIEVLDGLDLNTAIVEIAGKPLPASSLLTRGENKELRLNQKATSTLGIPDGFFTAMIKSKGQKLTLIKEQGVLRFFRPYQKSYALLISISEYQAGSGYPRLPQAVRQAKDLRTVLEAQGFEILTPLYDSDATAENIRNALLNTPVTKNDRMFVYFGGHGDDVEGFAGKRVGYLVPYNGTKKTLRTTAISLDELRTIATLVPAKQMLFALDSCQSGLVLTREASKADEERLRALRDIEAMSRKPGRMFLTAGTGGQAAIDVNGGIFTRALIEAIQGKADQQARGVTTFYTLYEYVRSTVSNTAKSYGREQDPAQDVVIGSSGWVFITDRTLLP